MNERIQLYYYGNSSPIVFVHCLGELKIPKRHFEINWPLEAKALILWVHPVFSWRNDEKENSKSVACLTPLFHEDAGSSLVSLHILGEKRILFAKILHTLSQPCAWPSLATVPTRALLGHSSVDSAVKKTLSSWFCTFILDFEKKRL